MGKDKSFWKSHENIACSCSLTREGWKDSSIKISQSLMTLCHSSYTRQTLTFFSTLCSHNKMCWDCRRLTAAFSWTTLLNVHLKLFIIAPEKFPPPLSCCIAITIQRLFLSPSSKLYKDISMKTRTLFLKCSSIPIAYPPTWSSHLWHQWVAVEIGLMRLFKCNPLIYYMQ